jgi:hypothetical protein
MKQIQILLILVGAFILLLYGCQDKDNGHHEIIFINKTEKDIVCQPWYVGNNYPYSDSLYDCKHLFTTILKDSSFLFEGFHSQSWEKYFEGDYGIFYIQYLVMDADTYDKYSSMPCDTIRKYVPVLHLYRLKFEDLERMNWTVVYPPEE